METIIHKQKYTFLMTLIVFIFNLCLFISPAKAAVHESSNVFDQAGVMSQKAINKIDRINAENLAKIKGHPQIAVITVDKTDNIEKYAQDQFDKYHFGHKGYNNGVLVVLAIKNHQIRIQTGYGVEEAIPDVWAGTNATAGEVKTLLRSKNYSKASVVMVQRISNRLKNELSASKSKNNAKEVKQALKNLVSSFIDSFIFFIIFVIDSGNNWGVYNNYDERHKHDDDHNDSNPFSGGNFGGFGGSSGGGGATSDW